jgi:hypothetical protein
MTHLTIIIPAYNAADYLEPCLRSILEQDTEGRRVQILVADDGSTDDTRETMARLTALYPEVTYLPLAHGGVSATRNAALQRAEGEWLMFMDADDMMLPHSLLPLLQAADARQADMVRGALVKMTDEQMAGLRANFTPATADAYRQGEVVSGRQALAEAYPTKDFNSVIYLYRRKFLLEQGVTFPPLSVAEDLLFVVDCLMKAGRWTDTGIVFYAYRQHTGSCMSTMNLPKLQDQNCAMAAIARTAHATETDNPTRRGLEQVFHNLLTYEVWYLTHHRSLFALRREVTTHLHRELQKTGWCSPHTVKQWMHTWGMRHAPLPYLSLLHLLARPQFE